MNGFIQFLEKYLSGPMGKLAAQRHLRAIRDGVASAIPFIIVGGFFLILAAPPLPEGNAIREWMLQHSVTIGLPFRVTMFVMSLYVAFGIGYNLAKSYKIDPLGGGQLALAALLMTNFPAIISAFDEAGAEIGFGWQMPLANFGGAGLFITMLISIFAVEILRLCLKYNITIRMPEQVPDSISRSFAAIFPAAIVVVLVGIVTLPNPIGLGIDLHGLMIRLVSPLSIAGDSLPGVLVLIFLITFFWSFGIHGVSVIGSIARPFWLMYSDANALAFEAGEALPHVAPETFYQWFIWIGGSGATLGLLFACFIVARSKMLKTMSKVCFVPGLFNINEPVIFGMPIVLNPILMIPFMIAPMVMAVIAWFATSLGLVSPTYIIAPWTLPAPIGAFIATGGDYMAIVLGVVNIAVATLIYIPFIKIYDKDQLRLEQGEVAEAV